MMREVKRSQERFYRDVQGRIDKTLADRHLPPRDGPRDAGASCIDTTQVVPSVEAPGADTSQGSQRSALAVSRPTQAWVEAQGVVGSGVDSGGSGGGGGGGGGGGASTTQAPGGSQAGTGNTLPASAWRSGRSLRGISPLPLPGSSRPSATPSTVHSAAGGPTSGADAEPLAHERAGGPPPPLPGQVNWPQVPPQQWQAAQASLAAPPPPPPQPQPQQQQQQQYAQAMEMLSLTELGIQAVDEAQGAPAPRMLQAAPRRDASHQLTPRRGRVAPAGPTPPQSEGRVSSTASFPGALKAGDQVRPLTPEPVESPDATEEGGGNANDQSRISTGSNGKARQRQQWSASPPRPTTRIAPVQLQPQQRTTGSSPRKRVPDNKSLVLDPTHQQAMKAGFALDLGADVLMVPAAAAGDATQPTDNACPAAAPEAADANAAQLVREAGPSSMAAARGAAAQQQVAARWNEAGQLIDQRGQPMVQDARAVRDPPQALALQASAAPSAVHHVEAAAPPAPHATARAPSGGSAPPQGASGMQVPGGRDGPARAPSTAGGVLAADVASGRASSSEGSADAQPSAAATRPRPARPVLRPLSQPKEAMAGGGGGAAVGATAGGASAAARGEATEAAQGSGPGGAAAASPSKRVRVKETRPGMKKIYVQTVVEGGVMDVEEWVPDETTMPTADSHASDTREIFLAAKGGVDHIVAGAGGNFGSPGLDKCSGERR